MSASCTTSMARSERPAALSSWPRVGQRGRQPEWVADPAVEGDGFLEEGSRSVDLAEAAMGDAEAIQVTRLLFGVAELAPDGQAALEQMAGGVGLALLIHRHAEPVRHLGQRNPPSPEAGEGAGLRWFARPRTRGRLGLLRGPGGMGACWGRGGEPGATR